MLFYKVITVQNQMEFWSLLLGSCKGERTELMGLGVLEQLTCL